MKYIIEDYFEFTYNALSKARRDVTSFVLGNGYKSVWKVNREEKAMKNGLYRRLNYMMMMLRLFFLKKNSILFFQSIALLKTFQTLKINKIRKIKSVFLIHDLLWLRFNTDESIRAHRGEIDADMTILNECDYIISHNVKMSEKLRYLGCNSNIIELEIFDYFTDKKALKRSINKNDKIIITYAGSIGKAKYLTELDLHHHEYEFNLYGETNKTFKHLNYKGCVDANELPSIIEGHFGLVWDDDYVKENNDNYGLLNNPHKLSMYIVSGMPVVVWEKSAAADFVKKYNIGTTIEKLDDLEDISTKLTPELYDEMVNNCLKIREELIKGKYIARALSHIN